MAFCALILLGVARAYDDPNKAYRIYSRCWQPYEADLHTLGLFHMGQSVEGTFDALGEEGEKGGGLAAGGVRGTVGKSSPEAPEGARCKKLTDSSGQPAAALICQRFQRGDAEGRFGEGVRLNGEGSVIISPSYTQLTKNGHFAVEAWFRPAKLTGTIFHLSGPDTVSLRLTPGGRLVARCGSTTVKTPPQEIQLDRWQHIALTVTPTARAFRAVCGTQEYAKDGLLARATGRFDRQPESHPPQLRVLVNGRILVSQNNTKFPQLVRRLDGSVRVGNNADGTAAFRGSVDELRISDQARKYYPHRLNEMRASDADDFPRGQPFLRSEEDEIIHIPLDGSLHAENADNVDPAESAPAHFAPGVHGRSAVAGPGFRSPVYRFRNAVSARFGSLEFWFSPYDWDNGKSFYEKEHGREEPPIEKVPIMGISSRQQILSAAPGRKRGHRPVRP
mgnify:CR=1 FL=1